MSCSPRAGRIHRALFPVSGVSLVLIVAVIFWSDRSPKPAAWQERSVLRGHTGPVLTIAFSPDGRQLASGDNRGNIFVWDLASGTRSAVLHHHEERLLNLAFSPDGQTLASGSSDGSILLWDVSQPTPIRTLQGHDAAVMGMTITPDGRTLISGSADGVVKLWDPNTGQERGLWQTQEKTGFTCLACSPDGAKVATGNSHRTVRIWDLTTRQEEYSLQESAGVYALAFADEGKSLVVGNGAGAVTVWDCAKQQPTQTLETGEAPILSVAATVVGRKVVSGSLGGVANYWNLENSRTPIMLEKDGMFIRAAAFSPDGNKLAFASNMDYSVKIWQAPADGSQ